MLQGDYLDLLKQKYDLNSDYAVAKFLRVTRSSVSKWRNEQTQFSPETALKIAELLNIPPENIAADMMASRSTDRKIKKKWMERGALLPCMLGIIIASSPNVPQTSQFNNISNDLYIMRL